MTIGLAFLISIGVMIAIGLLALLVGLLEKSNFLKTLGISLIVIKVFILVLTWDHLKVVQNESLTSYFNW